MRPSEIKEIEMRVQYRKRREMTIKWIDSHESIDEERELTSFLESSAHKTKDV